MKLFLKSILFAGAFSVALILLLSQGKDHGELHFWELNPADIASLQVVRPEQSYQLSLQSGKWQIKSDTDTWEGDALKVEGWLQPILHLHARSVLGGEKGAIADYKSYGLADPLSSIVINLSAGDKKKLLIGHRSPFGDTYYVKLATKPAVYLVSVYELGAFLNQKIDLLKATMESSGASSPQ